MSELLIKERTLVSPGELLAKGSEYLPGEGTYQLGDQVIAATIGFANNKNKVIEVQGIKSNYMPRRGDYVVGEVIDMNFSSWFININVPYDASLPVREASKEYIDLEKNDMTYYYSYGDVIFAKVVGVTKSRVITLSMKDPESRKLSGGLLTKINTSKIPRLIGTKGSMINMIKERTGTQIVIGQNGLVWIKGDAPNVLRVKDVINKISDESHTNGLTEKIEKMLLTGEE